MIDYEKLDVYRLALKFIYETIHIRSIKQSGNGDLIDQFKRASFSIVLNIAEGAGKFKQPDKQRYYGIARGSAMECAAQIDLFVILGVVSDAQHVKFKEILSRIISMLTVLCLAKS